MVDLCHFSALTAFGYTLCRSSAQLQLLMYPSKTESKTLSHSQSGLTQFAKSPYGGISLSGAITNVGGAGDYAIYSPSTLNVR